MYTGARERAFRVEIKNPATPVLIYKSGFEGVKRVFLMRSTYITLDTVVITLVLANGTGKRIRHVFE